MTSSDIIELHVRVHSALIGATGHVATEREKDACRQALQALVKLARNEYALGLVLDMRQVDAAMRD